MTKAWMNVPITFPAIPARDIFEEPLIVEAGVEGYLIKRVCVDEGSSVEVMFEHCFENFNPKIKAGLRETQTDLVGFAEEISKPLEKIELKLVTIGRGLSEVGRGQLKRLLKDNMEVFAWEPSDMTGVPRWIIEHALNVNLSLDPVCQKRRTFSIEKSRVVTNEVAEWVKTGIVHPVKYLTRSNRRRVLNIVEPEIRTIEEIVPMADCTMEELLQAPTEGYGEAIVIPEILAENFEIKTNLLQLVQANKFHGFERANPHTHISNFKRMTATLKYRDVLNDAIKLMLFPYSLEGLLGFETFREAWDRFKEMLRACPHHGFYELTQIDTFYNGLTEQDQDSLNAASGGNLLNKTTREALKIIENKSKVRYSRSKSNVSRVNTNSRDNVSKTDDRIDKLADQISNLVEIVNKQVIAPAKAEDNLRRNLNEDMRNILSIFFQNQPSTSGTLPSNTVPNPKGEMKAVTTRSGLAYEGPSIPTSSPLEKVDEQNTKEILDKEHSNSSGSIAQVQPSVVPISIPEPDVSRTKSKPTIPYPSRLNDQKLWEKATNQMEKFFQIFHDLHFDISFADALLLMPKFASTIKSLLANKDKLFELAKVPLNVNCSAMLLKKLPEKLGDPGKFLIPCDFPGMEVCHALADLGASINLIPLSIWKKLSLPELTPTRMTLELADRSITHPKGVSEDVFVKVGKFHFPTDFVVVDFEADPRVPLILGRSFLRTGHDLIDVYGEEITLRVNEESVNFNFNQIMRYSDNSVNRVNVINIACEEFVQDKTKSSNTTLVSESESCKEPIVKSSSPTLTPFRESDFFLEIEDFLNDDSIPTGIDNSLYDPEGDILYLENLLPGHSVGFKSLGNRQRKTIQSSSHAYSKQERWGKGTARKKSAVYRVRELVKLIDNESEYEVLVKDDSSPVFTTFSNTLFNDNDDFTSSDNESISDEEVLIEEFKVYLNPLFDSDFVETLSNHDALIDSSSKFDYLEEFSSALMPTSIVDEERIRREHAEYISLMERLFTINLCPRPMENSNSIVESLSSSPIPVQDSDYEREEIDIFTSTANLLPPSIESDDDN
nr:reverse transcriptase domain-containing protein [Tanacetum cinerariifolium]